MHRIPAALGLLCLTASLAGAEDRLHSFQKVALTDQFWAEGADFGDFNHDKKVDVVAGPFWYEGPDFKTRHEYWPATASFKRKKSDGTEEVIPALKGRWARTTPIRTASSITSTISTVTVGMTS